MNEALKLAQILEKKFPPEFWKHWPVGNFGLKKPVFDLIIAALKAYANEPKP